MAKMIQCQAMLAVVVSLASTIALAQSSGSAIYIPKCAGCHSPNGIVTDEYMKSRGTPNASDPYIQRLSLKQMFTSVKNGKFGANGPGMPPFKGRLTDAEITDVVAYFRQLGTAVSAQSSGSAATGLTPEQQKQMEDIKSHNAETLKYNEIVETLNADLLTSRQAIKDGDSAPDVRTKTAKYGEAETLMMKDTQIKPDASVLWLQLGYAQAGLMKYSQAETSFMKVIELEHSVKYPNSQNLSSANSELAKIHARTGMVAGTDIASPATSKMTNNEVIQLVSAGLSDQVVATSIRQASNKDFDLSPTGLIALKKAGVSDAVIAAMQESGTAAQAAPPNVIPQPPPAPAAAVTPAPAPTPASPCADIDYLGVIQAVTGGGMMAGSNAYGGRIRNRATYTKEVDFAWVMNGRAETGTFRVPAGQFIDVNLGVGSSPPTNVKVVTCR
jgi:mono/diheme cytochrome c family protein